MKITKLETHNLYNMISSMNAAFGNQKGLSVENGEITEFGRDRLIAQLKNLYDENKELTEYGFVENIRKEIFDAIADLSVFLLGANHFINQEMPDLEISFEDKIISFAGHNFSSKNDAINFVKERSLEILKGQIDEIIQAANSLNIEELKIKAFNLNVSLFTLFEIFKKDSPKYTMIYLNKLVFDSNMSKLCKNMDEVKQTLEFYRRKNVEVDFKESLAKQESGEPFYFVYSVKEQFVQDQDKNGVLLFNSDGTPKIKEYRKDKFLKNINWFEPDLTDF